MAFLGRRRPFPPIFKRLTQYQPVATAPVASKPLVVSFAALENRRPVISRIISKGLIRYQPIPPTAGKPFLVSQTAVEFRRPQVLRPFIGRTVAFQRVPVARAPYIATLWPRESTRKPHFETIINRLIQYQPSPPVADTPYIVSQVAFEFRRPQILRPTIGRAIKYQMAPPIAKPPFVVSFVAHNFRKPEFHGPIMKRLMTYAPPPPPPAARKPFVISQISVQEAERRAHTLRKAKTLPPPIIIPTVIRIVVPFLIPYEENDLRMTKRSRDHEQKVAKILNTLLLSGELGGTIGGNQMFLGYVPTTGSDWGVGPAGSGPPETIKEALDRIALLLKSLNGNIGP